jgi:hypothetical protein
MNAAAQLCIPMCSPDSGCNDDVRPWGVSARVEELTDNNFDRMSKVVWKSVMNGSGRSL